MSLGRREFLKLAAAHTGLLLTGACSGAASRPSAAPGPAAGRRVPDVVVVGAGAFGGWTAFHLRRLGASVTLVDQYGPGNSRATSGDETRGVRTSYGDRELWVRWANEAIARWRRWDEEWGGRLKLNLFFPTSDLILRPEWDPWLRDTRAHWDTLGVPYELLTIDEVRYRYPQIDPEGLEVAVVETNAGVVRARRGCEAVAAVFRSQGGDVVIARAALGRRSGRTLGSVALTPGRPRAAGQFVFACGPWFPKALPDVMTDRLRTPLGRVFYFGTPVGDNRFTYPNMPSFNVPGVTGWPGLPPDNRGFRVRGGGRFRRSPDAPLPPAPTDPDLSPRWFPEAYHEGARAFLAERFPTLKDAPLLETRACHYEFSVSRNFIVDRHPALDNVWIAGGGNAEGYKFGPVIGEYVARRVLGLETDPALAEAFRLAPGTFEELPTERSSDDAAGMFGAPAPED